MVVRASQLESPTCIEYIDSRDNCRLAMTPEQLDQIASVAQKSILNSLDMYIQSATEQLGISEEISDDDWQTLVDLILA